MAEVLVALGANLAGAAGGPGETLTRALAEIDALPGLSVIRVSRRYRTPAVPAGTGPDFVNAAAALATELSPEAVLAALHAVEARLGRTRPGRWSPRVCDLDLIAAGAAVRPDRQVQAAWMAIDPELARREAPERLVLPHPRMQERAFVLLPLAEIAPGWRHPVLGRTVADLLAALGPEAHRGISLA